MNHQIFQLEETETHYLIIFQASLTPPAGQHSSWVKASTPSQKAIPHELEARPQGNCLSEVLYIPFIYYLKIFLISFDKYKNVIKVLLNNKDA